MDYHSSVGKDGQHLDPNAGHSGNNDGNNNGNTDDDNEDEDGDGDRMDVYDDNEMDLVAYFDYSDPEPLVFDYSDPGPLVLSPQRTHHHNALHAFIESVTNGINTQSSENLGNILNNLVEGVDINVMENLFVRFQLGDLDCSHCQILRDIVHCNAYQRVKVCVHGHPSNFTHTIFEVENFLERTEPRNDRFYLDLSAIEESSWVDGFIKFYLSFLPVDGSTTMHDNRRALYETLCGRRNEQLSENNVIIHHPSSQTQPSTNSLDASGSNSALQSENPARRPRSNYDRAKTVLAAQRERTQTMSFEELSKYFHLSIARAAKELNLCSTAVKHICRRHGMTRWPGRKVISINKQLSKLGRLLATKEGEELENIHEQIRSLKECKKVIYSTGLPPSSSS